MELLRLAFTLILLGVAQSAAASRTLEHEAIIDASAATIWNAWTTSEGFASWAVAKAEIDLRLGGEMRTSYNPQSNLNDDSTIVNRIISFQPQRMLSIQNVKAPAGFKNAELFQSTWTVIYLDPLSGDRTQVRIVGMGFGEGPQWDDLYAKFKAGNQWTLDKLREKFARPAAVAAAADDAEGVLKVLASMTGGNWLHEQEREDGTAFRARVQMEFGPDGRSIISRGWLGNEQGMFAHAATQIWREPATQPGGTAGPVRFQSINERGVVARGEIHLAATHEILWDWLATEIDGTSMRYHIAMRLEGDNHFRFILRQPVQPGVDEERELVNFVYARVYELPAGFTKMKDGP